jgi:hypothetical protein
MFPLPAGEGSGEGGRAWLSDWGSIAQGLYDRDRKNKWR